MKRQIMFICKPIVQGFRREINFVFGYGQHRESLAEEALFKIYECYT